MPWPGCRSSTRGNWPWFWANRWRRCIVPSPPHAESRSGRAGEPRHGPPALQPTLLPHEKRYRRSPDALGYDTPSEFVRAYPASRQWLKLLLRRMDAVALVYRLAATLSPGVDGLETRVESHRQGRFDAVIMSMAARLCTTVVSKASISVRPSVQHKCHSLIAH